MQDNDHDTDNPEWTAEDFARAQGPEALSPAERAAFPRTRGPGRKAAKAPVYIRLSPEVLEHFKAGGAGWQTRIDEALKGVVAKRRAAR